MYWLRKQCLQPHVWYKVSIDQVNACKGKTEKPLRLLYRGRRWVGKVSPGRVWVHSGVPGPSLKTTAGWPCWGCLSVLEPGLLRPNIGPLSSVCGGWIKRGLIFIPAIRVQLRELSFQQSKPFILFKPGEGLEFPPPGVAGRIKSENVWKCECPEAALNNWQPHRQLSTWTDVQSAAPIYAGTGTRAAGPPRLARMPCAPCNRMQPSGSTEIAHSSATAAQGSRGSGRSARPRSPDSAFR